MIGVAIVFKRLGTKIPEVNKLSILHIIFFEIEFGDSGVTTADE